MYELICVAIMCLVTYIPRALPIAFFHREIKSEFIKSFLFYVPYAVMASLTFPSILYCTNNHYTAICGSITAIILSCFKVKMIIIVIISVAVVFLTQFVF